MKKPSNLSRPHLFTRSVPVFLLPLTFAVTLAGCYLLFSSHGSNATQSLGDAAHERMDCDVQQLRLKKYNLIQPLVFTDVEDEADELLPLKQQIASFIESKKQSGELESASVYVRRLNGGRWIAVNPTERYAPASLLKIPVMMGCLKHAEQNPAMLQHRVTKQRAATKMFEPEIESGTLRDGQSYTVEELLYYMIVHSDNEATAMLHRLLPDPVYESVFTDLGLTVPRTLDYGMTTVDFSRFYRALFNASYLNEKNSEFALQLLTKSSFRDGLTHTLPQTVTVAHKFGERAVNGNDRQLHESGIVYNDKEHPYLITVMTRGDKTADMSGAISEISAVVFRFMNNAAL